jgi:hypothetical protein
MSMRRENTSERQLTGKVKVIREADEKETSKNGIAHTYGTPLSTLLPFLKTWNSVEQALQEGDVSQNVTWQPKSRECATADDFAVKWHKSMTPVITQYYSV